jgi:hypothetical protein
MQAAAGPFPRAERSGKHCVASMRERSTLEVEMGGFEEERPPF